MELGDPNWCLMKRWRLCPCAHEPFNIFEEGEEEEEEAEEVVVVVVVDVVVVVVVQLVMS